MYNTYVSSNIALRSKGSLSFSFNDYYYYLNERFEKIPSSSSSCACCSFSNHGLSINPRFLYGLRQSSLIHCYASRRLILGGGGDRYCRLPSYDLDRVCCRDSYTIKESSNSSSRRRKEKLRERRERRFRCMVWEEKFENCNSGIDENVEAMLSLLTEDISENLVGIGKRNNKLGTGRIRVEKRNGGGSECSNKEEKKYMISDSIGKNSRGESESITIKSREDAWSGGGRKGSSSRSENGGLRKEGSSCSSYYSVLSSGDVDESDVDILVDDERYVGESLSSYENKESRKNEDNFFVGDDRKEYKKYKEDVRRYGEVLTQGNSGRMEIGVNGVSRNKVEKLAEVSVGQIGSRQESRFQDVYEIGAERASSSQRRSNDRENSSTTSINFVEETKEQRSQTGHQVIQQSGSGRKTQQLTERLDIKDSSNDMTSSSRNRFSGREEKLTASVNLGQEARERNSRMGHRIIEQNESTRKFQPLSEMSETRDTSTERASTSQRLFETGTKGREENSTSLVSLGQEAQERRNQADQQVDLITQSGKESQDTAKERASTSQRLFETRMKGREENSTSLSSSAKEVQEHRTQADQQVDWIRSGKESQDLTNVSVISATDTGTMTSSRIRTETIMSTQEKDSYSHVDLAAEAGNRHKQAGEQVLTKVLSRNESERFNRSSSFHKSSTERASSSQTALSLIHQSREQQKEDGRNSQVMVTPPPSQLVARGSPKIIHSQKATKEHVTQEVPQETSQSGSGALYIHSQGESPVLPREPDSRIKSNEIYPEQSRLVANEYTLVSANRLEESSTMFVGEFMEKLRHEVSTSELLEERTSSQTTSVHKDENSMQQSSNPQVSEDFQPQVHGSRRSSSESRRRGPSDEMWDVAGPSSMEPSKTEAPGETTPSSGGEIAKSTHRSLWSIVGDVVRLRWGTRSETHNLTVKPGGKSSSNESAGSEAWFSGHEPDDKDDEYVKQSRRGTPKGSRSSDQRSLRKSPRSQSEGDAYEGTSSHDEMIHIGADTPSSSNVAERSSASKGDSSAYTEETSSWKEDENRVQGTPFGITALDSSSPLLTKHFIRSPPIKQETSEINIVVSRSGSMEMVEQPIRERPAEASETEGRNGELKRRKLQRTKQVLTERFEEWEEAYMIESEQRRIDEMFMREALLEAKKAADTWEVPVGAVLVQHGKIIARGCNLVEELRDSTAHAEMICIREASNVLRTWRLSETTLYVTLEPCPMCAGAILQARIDNVVWGAPNKLLGADGSWVRLFPGGGEGGSGSDLTTQPSGPVHPFHPKITVRRGILATECADVMQQFFQLRRRKKEKKKSESPPPPCLPIATHHPSKFFSKMHDIFSIMFCL